jgi:hypothetical protein
LAVVLLAKRLLNTSTLQSSLVATVDAAILPSSPSMEKGLFMEVAVKPLEFRRIFSEFKDVANKAGTMHWPSITLCIK